MKTSKATTFVGLMVLVLAFASACSSGGGTTATTTPPTSASTSTSTGGTVTITLTDFKFTPSDVTASTSQDIVLVNNGAALHNFSIKGTSISIDIPPGQTQTLTAPGPSFQAGTYDFFCKYHQSSGMIGTLTATSG